MKWWIVVLALACLAGCAGGPKKRDELAVSQRHEAIVLAAPVSTAIVEGVSDVRIVRGARAGNYEAELEGEEGTYYVGTGRCIWVTADVDKISRAWLYQGGIYVPHDRTKDVHFFYVVEPNSSVSRENIDAYVQGRVIETAAAPLAAGVPRPGLGANVVGNVIAGAIIQSVIESGYGSFRMLPAIRDASVKQKLLEAIKTHPPEAQTTQPAEK